MFQSPLVRKLVDLALEEDLAMGDVTANLTIPPERVSKGVVVARQELVVCGLPIVEEIVKAAGWGLDVSLVVAEGVDAVEGTALVEVAGSTREMLSAERTILNFLQRLCGVATHTRGICQHSKGIKVLDTRKTMPGWRVLDKYAVRVGGGWNHRFSLGDMILVKNNHIDAHPEGIRGALASVVANKPLYMPWEVEVRNMEELVIALSFKPTIVMLDNFSDAAIREAVATIQAAPHRPVVEVSGGVTKDRLGIIQSLGVDAVSMGSLTTHATNVDISMRIS